MQVINLMDDGRRAAEVRTEAKAQYPINFNQLKWVSYDQRSGSYTAKFGRFGSDQTAVLKVSTAIAQQLLEQGAAVKELYLKMVEGCVEDGVILTY